MNKKVKLYNGILGLLSILMAVICMLIIYLFTHFHLIKINQKNIVTAEELKILNSLALETYSSKDVPVGAILKYNDTVIGTGCNDINKNKNAGGHAEINAISDALTNLNINNFNELDRKNLKMITTYEPCAMCRGALLNFGISNTIYLLQKPLKYTVLENLRGLKYEYIETNAMPDSLQENLFLNHPNNN